jgi:hypothetical protein
VDAGSTGKGTSMQGAYGPHIGDTGDIGVPEGLFASAGVRAGTTCSGRMSR